MTQTALQDSAVTFINNVMAPDKFTQMFLSAALDLISSDTYKAAVMGTRQLLGDDKRYRAAKKQLPAFSFSGTFTDNVENKNFQQSSGLFPFDIDKLSPDVIEAIKQKIISLPSCVFCFVSPSGKGLKGAVRIDPDPVKTDADFKRVYAQSEAFFKQLDITIDPSRKDVSGKCFVSYDPDIYVNFDAELFEVKAAVPEPEPTKPKAEHTKSPNSNCDTESICIERVEKCIKSSLPRHDARLRAGQLAGGYVAGGLIDEAKITDILMQVSDSIADGGATTNSERKTILDGIANGKKSPIYDLFQKQEQTENRAESPPHDEQPTGKADESGTSTAGNECSFKRVSLADVFTSPPEPQQYVWGQRIPHGELTLLAAHGGTGKSTFALQLAAHVATGTPFLGLQTEELSNENTFI